MTKSLQASGAAEISGDFRRLLPMMLAANAALVGSEGELPLLQAFCKIIVEKGEYAFAWVGYPRPDRPQRLGVAAAWGEAGDLLASLALAGGDAEPANSPAEVAWRTGKPHLCRDMQSDPSWAPWREALLERGCTACLALPLSTREAPLGALTIIAQAPNALPPGEVEALSRLADALAHGVMALRLQDRHQKLREELNRKARMLDFAGEAVFIHDRWGRFLEFNRATPAALGYGEEELRQLNLFQLEPPEYAQLREERLQQLVAQGEVAFPTAWFRQDGSVLPLHLRSRRLEQDGQPVFLCAARDASQFQQVTDQLQRCERRCREILVQARMGVFRLRLGDGRLEVADQRMAEIFGYADPPELVRQFVLARTLVEAGVREKMAAAFENETLERFETRCYRRDGSIVWVLISARLSPRDGIIEGVVSDISGRKRLEEELQKAEDRCRRLVEQQLGRSLLCAMERRRLEQELSRERELAEKVLKSTEDGILTFDRTFRLTRWNEGMETITGLNRANLLNLHLFEVMPVFQEIHEQTGVFDGGPARHLLDGSQPLKLTPSSPEGCFEAHFFPLEDGGETARGGLVVIRNLSGLRAAQAALEEKDRLWAGLFDTSRDGVFLLNQDFAILRANSVMQQWYGPESSLAGQQCYTVLRGRTRPCATCPAVRVTAPGEVHQEVIARRGPQGEILGWLDLSAYPVVDQQSGRIIGIIERAAAIPEQPRREEAPGEVKEPFPLEPAVAAARQEPTLEPPGLPGRVGAKPAPGALRKDRREKDRGPRPAALPRLKDFRETAIARAEKQYLQDLMDLTDHDLKEACRVSNLSLPRLYALLKKHGVGRPSNPGIAKE